MDRFVARRRERERERESSELPAGTDLENKHKTDSDSSPRHLSHPSSGRHKGGRYVYTLGIPRGPQPESLARF